MVGRHNAFSQTFYFLFPSFSSSPVPVCTEHCPVYRLFHFPPRVSSSFLHILLFMVTQRIHTHYHVFIPNSLITHVMLGRDRHQVLSSSSFLFSLWYIQTHVCHNTNNVWFSPSPSSPSFLCLGIGDWRPLVGRGAFPPHSSYLPSFLFQFSSFQHAILRHICHWNVHTAAFQQPFFLSSSTVQQCLFFSTQQPGSFLPSFQYAFHALTHTQSLLSCLPSFLPSFHRITIQVIN